jgi:hypothetical protein
MTRDDRLSQVLRRRPAGEPPPRRRKSKPDPQDHPDGVRVDGLGPAPFEGVREGTSVADHGSASDVGGRQGERVAPSPGFPVRVARPGGLDEPVRGARFRRSRARQGPENEPLPGGGGGLGPNQSFGPPPVAGGIFGEEF